MRYSHPGNVPDYMALHRLTEKQSTICALLFLSMIHFLLPTHKLLKTFPSETTHTHTHNLSKSTNISIHPICFYPKKITREIM